MSDYPNAKPVESPEERAQPGISGPLSVLVETVRILFDPSGCDCDIVLYHHAGDESVAESHATDCPVYERWAEHEPKARDALASVNLLSSTAQKEDRDANMVSRGGSEA